MGMNLSLGITLSKQLKNLLHCAVIYAGDEVAESPHPSSAGVEAIT